MKNNKIALVSIMILMIFVLGACSSGAPRCNDTNVKEAVINRLLTDKLNGQRTNWSKMINLINLRLEDIRVNEEDSKSKQCVCSATIKYIAYKQPWILEGDGKKITLITGPFNDDALALLRKEEVSEQIKYKAQKAVDTGALWLAIDSSLRGKIIFFSESDQVLKLK